MLTFLRHGETKWNPEGRIQGTLDTRLSTYGRQCVEQYAKKNLSLCVNVIWTSPLRRAKETALILATHFESASKHVPLYELDALVERAYGVYQGQKLEHLQDHLLASREDLVFGADVEPWYDLQQRVLAALRTIAAGPDQALIVVHGGWLKAMHSLLQTGLQQENAGNLTGYSLRRSTLISILDKMNLREIG